MVDLVIVIIFLCLQLISALILYRYWEFVLYNYDSDDGMSGGSNNASVSNITISAILAQDYLNSSNHGNNSNSKDVNIILKQEALANTNPPLSSPRTTTNNNLINNNSNNNNSNTTNNIRHSSSANDLEEANSDSRTAL
eukprot:gene10936-14682_t